MKIGVFDSGIGGLTVLGEIRQKLPSADIYYFGDNANVPYGNKTVTEIKTLVKAAANRIKEQNVDVLVMACNTASCLAIEEVQLIMGMIPVLGVVESGVETVIRELKKLNDDKSIPILILGTKATIKSHVYSDLLKKKKGLDFQILEQECPLLVSMIEEGWTDNEILKQTLYQYLKPYTHLPPGICLLGCTHYPWIKSSIARILPNWKILDSSIVLSEKLNLRFQLSEAQQSRTGITEYLFTDPASIPKFIQEQINLEHGENLHVSFK